MTNHRPRLETGEIYHLYNKSIADTSIFSDFNYLKRALVLASYYRFNQRLRLSKFYLLPKLVQRNYLSKIHLTTPLVDFYAFSFMPNHYHFLVKQMQDD